MSWEPNWEAEAAELAAPLIAESANIYDEADDAPEPEFHGSPCCPKCEMCGRALDECGCFDLGGDDQ